MYILYFLLLYYQELVLHTIDTFVYFLFCFYGDPWVWTPKASGL
jgi:hypothetical protein